MKAMRHIEEADVGEAMNQSLDLGALKFWEGLSW
jgi:hypothetical protein